MIVIIIGPVEPIIGSVAFADLAKKLEEIFLRISAYSDSIHEFLNLSRGNNINSGILYFMF